MKIITIPLTWAALIIYALGGRLLGLIVCAVAVRSIVWGSRADGGLIMVKFKSKWVDSWFGNASDGLAGDKRGEWTKIVKGNNLSLWSLYRWSALRNGFHNGLLKPWAACDVRKCYSIEHKGAYEVSDKPGDEGWQFTTAKTDRRTYYGLNVWLKYPWSKNLGLMIKMGHKVKPDHWTVICGINVYSRESKYFKTFTFYFNPLQSGHGY